MHRHLAIENRHAAAFIQPETGLCLIAATGKILKDVLGMEGKSEKETGATLCRESVAVTVMDTDSSGLTLRNSPPRARRGGLLQLHPGVRRRAFQRA